MTINLTAKQTADIRAKLAQLGKAANKKFRDGNPDYCDKQLDFDDIQVLKGIGINSGARSRSIESCSAELADMRSRYLTAGRNLFTLDRMTMTTEKDIPEEQKFVLKPWMFVKQSRTDEIMYQQPKAETPTLNSLLTKSGNEHQVLRAKRVMQLASDEEIEAYCSDLEISLDLFLQLS